MEDCPRAWCYTFLSILECRKKFEGYYKIHGFEWDKDDPLPSVAHRLQLLSFTLPHEQYSLVGIINIPVFRS